MKSTRERVYQQPKVAGGHQGSVPNERLPSPSGLLVSMSTSDLEDPYCTDNVKNCHQGFQIHAFCLVTTRYTRDPQETGIFLKVGSQQSNIGMNRSGEKSNFSGGRFSTRLKKKYSSFLPLVKTSGARGSLHYSPRGSSPLKRPFHQQQKDMTFQE